MGNAQQEAFVKIKDLLTRAPILTYFDPSKQLTIQCDASFHGMGAVMQQNGNRIV
jgi:hypothetical protein